MGVAVFTVHGLSVFDVRKGGFEYAGVLLLACVSLVFSGSGLLSVDQVFRGGKPQ